MKKDQQEYMRVDMLTKDLVIALQDRMGQGDKKASKSDVYSTGVYRLAKDLLPQEEFQQIVLSYNDILRS